jgi:hypothetical protein
MCVCKLGVARCGLILAKDKVVLSKESVFESQLFFMSRKECTEREHRARAQGATPRDPVVGWLSM